MPARQLPLVNDEIYHIYNRGINRQPTFITNREYNRAKHAIRYYRHASPPIRLAHFLKASDMRREEIIVRLQQTAKLVEVFAYVLMPNHFHLLLRQILDQGISKTLSNFQNSYTRYFNTLNKRDGAIFLDQFKAVHVETDEQFLHVLRYIHLNPYTSFVVKTIEDLENYVWSSYPEYLQNLPYIASLENVMAEFKNIDEFKKFHTYQAAYQLELGLIKHLTLE